MSTVRTPYLTPQEYLVRERAAGFRSQYYRGETFAMAGASKEHVRARDNMARVMGNQLLGGPCEVYSSDLRVKVSPTGLYTYPDIVIACEAAEFEDDEIDTLLNPRLLVEVLSPTTESFDRGRKFEHYQTLDSLQEYVLVSQDRPRVERFARQGKDWVYSIFAGLDSAFESACLPLRIPLSEIYRAVTFPPADEATNEIA